MTHWARKSRKFAASSLWLGLFALMTASVAALPANAGPLNLTAGDILISNHGGNNVQLLQPNGTVSTLVTTPSTPIGLAFDPTGNLYVNTGNGIVKFDKNTGLSTPFFTGAGTREGLTFATANSSFYSVDFGSHKVDEVNLAGTLVQSFSLPDGGTPVGISARGTSLVIGDYSTGNVYLGSTTNNTLTLVGNVDANATYGVDIDASGNIYANDFSAGTVDKFTSNGLGGYTKSIFISGLNAPANGLSIGDDGSFTISEFGGNAISVYNSDGTLRHRYTGVANPDELVVYAPVRQGIAAPEPASLTLLGLGALGLAGYGWRKRRRTVSA